MKERIKVDLHVLGVNIPESLALQYEALRKERKLRQAIERDLNELVTLREIVERYKIDLVVTLDEKDRLEKQLEAERELRKELIAGIRG